MLFLWRNEDTCTIFRYILISYMILILGHRKTITNRFDCPSNSDWQEVLDKEILEVRDSWADGGNAKY